MGLLTPIFLLFTAGTVMAQFNYCPRLADDSPCRCQLDFNEVNVFCANIRHPDVLYDQVQSLQGYNVATLYLSNMHLPYLSPGLFLSTSVKRLYIANSELESLYAVGRSHPGPFEGLEYSLEEIHVVNTMNPNIWYWPDMSSLKRLTKFEILKSPIDFIGHIFAEMGGGSIESIIAVGGNVTRIHPQAFPEMLNIKEADFSSNLLPYLVRTMFPNPAPRLQKLNFRHNKLFTLNENMFENMPALEFLDFSQNEFKTFENTPFVPVWNQLEFFFMCENPFECDCSILPLREKLISGPKPFKNDLEKISCGSGGGRIGLREIDTSALQCKAW